MFRIFTTIIALLLIFNVAYACDTPEKTVLAYLKFDFQGQRLGDSSSVDIDRLTENPNEPAWDVVSLTTGYEVLSIKEIKNTAVVVARFSKSWETARKFNPASVNDEVIEILLEKKDGCWKVGPPFYQPHVNPMVALKHLEKLLADGKRDNLDKEYLAYTNSVLKSVRQYIDSTRKK